jgi:hypothetical protein
MYGLSPLRFCSPSFVTNSLGPNDPKVGDVARVDDESYVFCYNAGNSAIKVGDGVIVSAVSGYSVTLSSTTCVDMLVGIVKHATISTGYYGYVCTRGWSQVNMGADFSCAAGAGLILAADGKFTAKTTSTGYVAPVQVKAMEAIASGASGTAYISIW